MVFRFRLIGTDEHPFYRDFEIMENQTFFDFHTAILDELGYAKNQLASFFLADDNWEKGLEINLFDMAEDSFTPVTDMDIKLHELIGGRNRRLLYVFDFFSDRAFYLELNMVIPPGNDKDYPCCISGSGAPPRQTIIPGSRPDFNGKQ